MIKIRWYQCNDSNTPPVLQYKVWLSGSAVLGAPGFTGKWSIWMPVETFYEE